MENEDKLRGYLNRIIQTSPELAESKIKTSDQKYFLIQRNYWKVLEMYINKFFDSSLKQRIVMVPGLRGIGKTTLLFKSYHFLLNTKNIPPERLLYIDAGELRDRIGSNVNELIQIYEETYLEDSLEKMKKPLILFIDEAHYDNQWPSLAKSLFDRSEKVLIFVSGSSALALRVTTDLSRRAIKDHLFPLSFQEYLALKKNFFPPQGTAQKIRVSLEGDLDSAYFVLKNTYNSLQKKITNNKINIDRELINFLSLGASPLSLGESSNDLSFRWWIEVIDKVIKQDLPAFSQIGRGSAPSIFGLLQFLAESVPSSQSLQSISQKLERVSTTSVFNMFDALKNACLLFEINQDIDSLRKINKSSKYYFIHPTLRAALLWNIGKFKSNLIMNNTTTLGILFEDAIGATFFRNKELKKHIIDLFFDDQKQGSDFVIKTSSGNIAVECCWGKKDPGQVINTINRFNCKFGIIIAKTNSVSKNDNIITVPRGLFLFI